MDLVRRTLEEARGAARSQGKDVGRGRALPHLDASRGQAALVVGAGHIRDPQTLELRRETWGCTGGWSPRVAEGTVFGQWETVVAHFHARVADGSA